ncbi:ABC transporter ATP-binding protein [Rhodococcus sp. NPDC058521]|uniref:ABC transporter ATP-binding protein n=1 Tax=Rhodococcus sp. NPDC058521 TaxID=3346536 RepID=UPI00365A5AB3
MTDILPTAPTAYDEASAVRIRGLTARTHDRILVADVDLDVPARKVTALVGASGSGKTTTALALMGEVRPGVRVATVTTEAHGVRFGYVPQQPSSVLNPALRIGTVLDDIAREGRRNGRSVAVADALARAGFPGDPQMLRRYPHQLSGGQQQRLVIAQALLTDPTCLILDEPTTGQDPVNRAAILDEISRLRDHGLTVVLVTHDLAAVERVAEHVIVMADGKVVDAGDPENILAVMRTEVPHARIDALDRASKPETARVAVDSITAAYRNTAVLEQFSLPIGAGECVALVGPSGCGKSTAARVIAGLHAPTVGRVVLDGQPLAGSVRRRTREQAAAIGYVFQDAKAAFDPYRSVWDQIVRGQKRLRRVPDSEAIAAARRALERVGLAEPIARQRAIALSGGEAQRAALARALAVEPSVLICDEVTTGLDPASQRHVLTILAELVRSQQLSLLIISHDSTVVDTIADRVIDMSLPEGGLTRNPADYQSVRRIGGGLSK